MRALRPLFFGLLALFLSQSLSAQAKRLPKRVLLIPMERFEFHTEYSLSEINKVNKMEGDQYFDALRQVFVDAFVIGDRANVIYQVISPEDHEALKPFVKFMMWNGHYGADISGIHENHYKRLLEDYQCEYVLLIDWYRIFLTRRSVKDKGIKRINNYSEHMVDYDFFDMRKSLLKSESAIRFSVEPTVDNLSYMGLRIADLRVVYSDLADRISAEISSGR